MRIVTAPGTFFIVRANRDQEEYKVTLNVEYDDDDVAVGMKFDPPVTLQQGDSFFVQLDEPSVETLNEPECPGPDCWFCSGEACAQHGQDPCDCDSSDRHDADADAAPSVETPDLSERIHLVIDRAATEAERLAVRDDG